MIIMHIDGHVLNCLEKMNINMYFQTFMPLLDTESWRYQMETFSALLALCEGNPSKRPVTRCFDVFFDEEMVDQTIEAPVI